MKKFIICTSMLLVGLFLFICCACSANNQNSNKEDFSKLEGNQEKYDFSHIKKVENSPLEGKELFVLGASVAYGHCSMQQSIGEYFKARYGMNVTKETVSGTTLANTGSDSFIPRLEKEEYKNKHYDMFICHLPTNDATKKLPLGSISAGTTIDQLDTSTITGALEHIIYYVKQKWNCPICFYTGAKYDCPEYDLMINNLKEVSKKWDITIVDLWNNKDFNNISDTDRKLYMYDKIHPTKAGYRDWWYPQLEKELSNFIKKI